MRPIFPNWIVLSGIAALTLAGTAAMAQVTPEQQSAMRANCRSDFMSKCSGVSPGGKDALTCLQKNVASLSAACKAVVSATLPPPPAAAAPAAPAPAPAATAKPAEPAAKPAPAVAATPAAPKSAAPPSAAAPKPPAVKTTATPTPTAKPAQPAAPMSITPTAPAVAAVPPPSTETPSSGPPPAAALMLKACARFIVMHCRGIEPGGGRIAACLNARVASGEFVGPRCKTALKVSAALD